jgi:hypothetical protein
VVSIVDPDPDSKLDTLAGCDCGGHHSWSPWSPSGHAVTCPTRANETWPDCGTPSVDHWNSCRYYLTRKVCGCGHHRDSHAGGSVVLGQCWAYGCACEGDAL